MILNLWAENRSRVLRNMNNVFQQFIRDALQDSLWKSSEYGTCFKWETKWLTFEIGRSQSAHYFASALHGLGL
jgi:hypothetical protein